MSVGEECEGEGGGRRGGDGRRGVSGGEGCEQ